MTIRPITNETEYEAARLEISQLIASDPGPGSDAADRLAVLAILAEKYEQNHFPITDPTPLEAIRFRMDQEGLTPRDLEPYIGSRSKVSEVLAGKKQLSLRMIRALHDGLGISATVLLKRPALASSGEVDWAKFPVREMSKRGWISASKSDLRERPAELAQRFFTSKSATTFDHTVLFRRTVMERTGALDRHALFAWIARVESLAEQHRDVGQFRRERLTSDMLRNLAQLSPRERAPLDAREMLKQHGVVLVVERHLPKTRLDGASFIAPSGRAVVGLTLRYDRLDNFWFTLMHELAHLSRHFADDAAVFVDDVDVPAGENLVEHEADAMALEALVPRRLWRQCRASRQRSEDAIAESAKQLGVHPAIVAGRIRHDSNNYHLFSNLVGHRQVRVLFEAE